MEDCHLSQLLFGIIGEDNLVSCSINLKCQPQEGDKVSTSQPHRKCAIKELQIPSYSMGRHGQCLRLEGKQSKFAKVREVEGCTVVLKLKFAR